MCVLLYIISTCPGIWSLNDMFKMCERFSMENSILINKNKTICIYFEVRLEKEKGLY